MLFFRILQHLLPRAAAWSVTTDKALRRYLIGLSKAPTNVRAFIDQAWAEAFPDQTTNLERWEAQFGLVAASDETTRRLQLAATWAAQGGQSPAYLEGIVRAAGFDVRLYECWQSTSPYVARDPRPHIRQPLIGSVQAGDAAEKICATSPLQAAPASLPPGIMRGFELYPQANAFVTNDVGYLVNSNLTPNAPPAVPDDAATWPFFIYWAGETIDTPAIIDPSRRAEFERLLLRICPLHTWIVVKANYGMWRWDSGRRWDEPNLRWDRPAP